MRIPYPKPHLPISDQLALLQQRGMAVADPARAERYLGSLGYYRLSGYWYPARQVTLQSNPNGTVTRHVEDTFRPGTTFERAVDLYVFDKRLRMLCMDALERIEVGLRVQAALLLSARDPLAHRDPQQLHGNFTRRPNPRTGRTAHAEWLARLDDYERRSNEEFVTRFHQKYSTPLPIWIAIELWDFGLMSHFIAGMRHADQVALANIYQIPRADLLTGWLRTLNHVRNVSAHHSRLWNRVSTELPKMPRPGEVPLLEHLVTARFAHNRVYAALALTQYFMRRLSPASHWSDRLKQHVGTFPAGPGVDFRAAGFPNNWRQLPLWL